jgi:hypothetical protein
MRRLLLALLVAGSLPSQAGDSWLSVNGADPVDYIAGTLEEHPIVLLGEGHWIRHDVELVAELVRREGGSGFEVLASELYPASLQARVDALVAAEEWDRPLGISILRAQGWPYEEYLDVLKAAWEVNRNGRELRVVALNPGSDWRETLLPRGETYEDFMARLILEATPSDSIRLVAHMGFHHAFTRYLQPDSWRADRVFRFMDRTGNLLWRARGDRVFMIALHPPFLCPEGESLRPCIPVEGLLDCAASAAGRPVGFDLAESPFADIPVRSHYTRGYRDLVLADLADGWIWHTTPDRYESVRLIPFSDYVPGPAELAEALAKNPFDDEGEYDRDSLRALWDERERRMADFTRHRNWSDAGAWARACAGSTSPRSRSGDQ